jgi:hypothetical protein
VEAVDCYEFLDSSWAEESAPAGISSMVGLASRACVHHHDSFFFFFNMRNE